MRRVLFSLILSLCGTGLAVGEALNGVAIYEQHCASCHGAKGEGVAGKADDPLQGERALESLASYIDRRMPEDNPDLVNAEESKAVAEYIMGAFYSPQSRVGQREVFKPAFARLTNRQFQESVADLLGSFSEPSPPPDENRGLKAKYFQSKGMNKKDKLVLEREDRSLAFDFGEGSPVEGIAPDQFSVAWEGSLLAPATGWYEFRLSTPNGARFYLNGQSEEGDGNHRDDSTRKRQEPLIDSWVSSGAEVRQVSARLYLLGGRSYPLKMDYFKYMEAKGMVKLEWKAPRAEWEVLAAPWVSPAPAQRTTIVSTAFPPDDASEGYERGTEISKAWHEATTQAALSMAQEVASRLGRLSKVKDNDPERGTRLKEFIATMAGRAFRRPLTDHERQLYVERPFADGADPDSAIKRAVILLLKSPRFLYPGLGEQNDDFAIASRLALQIWDSLPDRTLTEAAQAGQLKTPEHVKAQAARMTADPRARAKVNEFFLRWLMLDVEGDLSKSPEAFPGFDAAMVSDLRRSLELFVDRVVWSGTSDYRELIQADYLIVNERLAGYYGLPWPGGEGFQSVKCDPAQRCGILTHPYLLARLAHHDTTSPIHRGVFLTRHVLGGILKPPPVAIAFENQTFNPHLTTREKVAELTRNASCMTCHETINPLGFSLENFDAVGRFRTKEGDMPVNAESDYVTLEGNTMRLRGPRDLAGHAVDSETARRGFIRQLFHFVVKQNPAVYGPATITKLDAAFTASSYNIRNLLVEMNTLAALPRSQDP